MIHSFSHRIASGPPILADGAMGTQLYERLGFRYLCFEELNISDPQLVQRIHRDYLAAGAELIETNTFACNRYLLQNWGLEQNSERYARAGARIAREAQEAMGAEAFVAGAVGPISRQSLGVSSVEIRSAFEEVVEGLIMGGVDLFILETFGSLEELLMALEVCRASSDKPVVASMTFTEDGRTLAGEQPEMVSATLQKAGATVAGANCGFGPQPTFEIVQKMRFENGPALSAMPNAGLPARIDGRLVYSSSPSYFAEYAERMTSAGVRIIGGCCGTTAAHTRAMRESIAHPHAVDGLAADAAPAYTIDYQISEAQPQPVETQGEFARALQDGKFVLSVEMRPSRGSNPRKLIRSAQMLKDAGVSILDVTDSAMARVRMSPFASAYLIQSHIGIEVIAHLTTRDRNLMALQADLLGAHALGLRHILALTGDPPTLPAKGVYDVDSIGLIALIKKLNEGQDGAGKSIGEGTDFLVGCSVNPTADDLDIEIERFQRKLEAGADFVMTQAVYDVDQYREVMRRIGPLDVPVILEILPLQSYKNAEFIHNELAGVTLPRGILERMREAGSEGIAAGMEIARETFLELRNEVQGVYLIPSFDRYEQAAVLVEELKRHVDEAA
jgi:methionine synthase / methylenetetrahydrofolate reductase(NADPH)